MKIFFLTVTIAILSLIFCKHAVAQNHLEDKSKEFFDIGISFYNDKNFDKAIENFDVAIKLSSVENHLYCFSRGSAYLERGKTRNNNEDDFNSALLDFDFAITLENETAEYFYNRGITHQFLHYYTDAYYDYEKACSLETKYTSVLKSSMEIAKRKMGTAEDRTKSITEESTYDSLGNNLYKILYNKVVQCYLYLPPETKKLCIFKQDFLRKGNGSSDVISDLTSKTEFLNNFGKYISSTKKENKKLIVTMDDGSEKWETQINFKFGASLNDLNYHLENTYFFHPLKHTEFPSIVGWFNLPEIKKTNISEKSKSKYEKTNIKNTFQIFFDNKSLGYIYIPSDVEMFTLYLQNGDLVTIGSTIFLNDDGEEVDQITTETFKNNLGYYIYLAGLEFNKRLIVSAFSSTRDKWLASNRIKFGRESANESLGFSEMWHPRDKVVYHMTGWINYDYMKK